MVPGPSNWSVSSLEVCKHETSLLTKCFLLFLLCALQVKQKNGKKGASRKSGKKSGLQKGKPAQKRDVAFRVLTLVEKHKDVCAVVPLIVWMSWNSSVLNFVFVDSG